MGLSRALWGTMSDGTDIDLYTLTHASGTEVSISTYGGTVTRLLVPYGDEKVDVVLGFDSLEEYFHSDAYLGCLVGRVANRVGNGRFVLDGHVVELDRNSGNHQLHGGKDGFSKQLWQAEEVPGDDPALRLHRLSPDGEGGYPGNLEVSVTVTLECDGLRFDMTATADAPTVVNLTNHCYFNLSGTEKKITDHRLRIFSNHILATDEEQIPTGEVMDVTDTPMDFRVGKSIGEDIDTPFEPLRIGGGFDHYYVLDKEGEELALAAEVCVDSGPVLQVWSTHLGVQFYSGNFLARLLPGKGGVVYGPRSGFCLEAHGYVDAPSRPEFPSVRCDAETDYSHTLLYKFPAK